MFYLIVVRSTDQDLFNELSTTFWIRLRKKLGLAKHGHFRAMVFKAPSYWVLMVLWPLYQYGCVRREKTFWGSMGYAMLKCCHFLFGELVGPLLFYVTSSFFLILLARKCAFRVRLRRYLFQKILRCFLRTTSPNTPRIGSDSRNPHNTPAKRNPVSTGYVSRLIQIMSDRDRFHFLLN